MPGPRMVAVGMGNNRPVHGETGVDIGLGRPYIKIMAQQLHLIDIEGPSPRATPQRQQKKKPLADHPLTGWLRARGWDWFPHQLEVLAAARAGKDVLLCAPTGGGKTLGGFLPALMELPREGKPGGLHTLYISPLKALTVDVHRNIGRPIAELELPITYETRTGDTPASKRQRQKTKPPDILMTTPESLALLLSYDNAAEYFKSLRYIIVDELHALMHSKRGDLLALALARLDTLAPAAQRIGLSATIADPQMARDWFCRGRSAIVQAPARVQPEIRILRTAARIPWAGHMALYAMPEIYKELCSSSMSIVFVNTRAQAELIFRNLWLLNDKNLKIALHHGSLERELRRKVEDRMAKGEIDCVVATSSLDLGLDWAEVDLVIQIGAPKGVSRLLQRIGRSNHRLNEPSRAVLVPTNRFEYLECLAAREAIAHRELDGVAVKKGGLDVLAQHIFGTACSGPFRADDLYKEARRAWPYRDLPRADFDDVLKFIENGGYALRAYERYHRLHLNGQGFYELSDPRMARQYRMNIGTIVEAPMLQVKMGRRKLGLIEEYFINHLSPGDTFLFAGQVVRFDRLHDMTVMVSRTKAETPKIPSYDGGKLPLSTHLSLRVRQFLQDEEQWNHLPAAVENWMRSQQRQSLVPAADRMLVESFPRGGKHYLVAYPFAGRNAHQTLGFLIMRRMTRAGAKPLGFVATDYALVIWSLNKAKDIEELFSVDLLGEELQEWLDDTPLLKRTFREAAVIAGLIERRHPGQQKSGRQMTFSSDLIYDVLRKYEPNHILLRAAQQDAGSGMIDTGRLTDMLVAMEGRITVRHLERISPLAIPMILEIARESVSRRESGEYYLEELQKELLQETGLAAE
jgi:ATP-dependent helicase Lhr and Lhr-like helicase